MTLKIITLVAAAVGVLTACGHSRADVRKSTLFGMTFSAEYRNGVPHQGSVPHQGASDYFWIVEYMDGRSVARTHYYVRDGKPEVMGRDAYETKP